MAFLPSHTVIRFSGVGSLRFLTLPQRYSVLKGTIPAFPYPPTALFGFEGDDSGVFLLSHTVIRFCRVRFRRFLTLPQRYSVLKGTIQAFSYSPIPLFGLAGYDSGASLPSHTVIRFCRGRFRRFHCHRSIKHINSATIKKRFLKESAVLRKVSFRINCCF